MLDSRDDYNLAPNVDARDLAVARFVRLGLARRNGQEVVTRVSPGPPALAGYWVGKAALSQSYQAQEPLAARAQPADQMQRRPVMNPICLHLIISHAPEL